MSTWIGIGLCLGFNIAIGVRDKNSVGHFVFLSPVIFGFLRHISKHVSNDLYYLVASHFITLELYDQ